MVILVVIPCKVLEQTCDDMLKHLGTLQTLKMGVVITVAIIVANGIIVIARI